MKRARLLRIDGKGTGKIGFVGDVVAKQTKNGRNTILEKRQIGKPASLPDVQLATSNDGSTP